MIERPSIPDEDLVERVRQRYGLPIDAAEFLPLGNDSAAWAFRLAAGDETWFLKVLAREVDPAGLEIPRTLAALGIEHLLPPIPTMGGASVDTGEPFQLIVYPFVEGELAADVGLDDAQRMELGRLVRRIHEVPVEEPLASMMRRERFVPPDLDDARAIARAIEAATFVDPYQRRMASVWREHKPEIDRILDRTEDLAPRAAKRSRPVVICHADIHAWNVLVTPPGEIVVIDWDEALLAPPERDLMFVSGGVGDLDPDGSSFYAGYGEADIDPIVMAYYRFDWVVQEIADYGRRVFHDDVGDETKEEAIEMVEDAFRPGRIVERAFEAAQQLDARPRGRSTSRVEE